jgi:hypothetical protein
MEFAVGNDLIVDEFDQRRGRPRRAAARDPAPSQDGPATVAEWRYSPSGAPPPNDRLVCSLTQNNPTGAPTICMMAASVDVHGQALDEKNQAPVTGTTEASSGVGSNAGRCSGSFGFVGHSEAHRMRATAISTFGGRYRGPP